jgi:hypothetical protein
MTPAALKEFAALGILFQHKAVGAHVVFSIALQVLPCLASLLLARLLDIIVRRRTGEAHQLKPAHRTRLEPAFITRWADQSVALLSRQR